MDHEALAKELIRALRGRRSQVALSRRLKRRSNVLYAWEAGLRAPTAAGFLDLAKRVGVDIDAGVATFLGGLPEPIQGQSFASREGVAALLTHLGEGTTLVELAARVGKNRVSVGRWLKGEAEPRLPDFLRLIDASSLRLLDFVALFAPPQELPAARGEWERLEAQRRVAYLLPWSHAVLRVLELVDYQKLPKHEDGFIAARLGISEAEEHACLEALAESRLIVRRRGRYAVSSVLTVDTRQNPAAGRALKSHWARVAEQRLPSLEPGGEDLFSYNLFTVSEKDWERLREMHIAYFQELRRVIGASEPAERVALVNLQLLRLDESPSSQAAGTSL
jgi:transcriptional regulator with XRE-family HTH domain